VGTSSESSLQNLHFADASGTPTPTFWDLSSSGLASIFAKIRQEEEERAEESERLSSVVHSNQKQKTPKKRVFHYIYPIFMVSTLRTYDGWVSRHRRVRESETPFKVEYVTRTIRSGNNVNIRSRSQNSQYFAADLDDNHMKGKRSQASLSTSSLLFDEDEAEGGDEQKKRKVEVLLYGEWQTESEESYQSRILTAKLESQAKDKDHQAAHQHQSHLLHIPTNQRGWVDFTTMLECPVGCAYIPHLDAYRAAESLVSLLYGFYDIIGCLANDSMRSRAPSTYLNNRIFYFIFSLFFSFFIASSSS